jgi:hypothetical protein
MSVETLAIVLNHSQASGTDKLVLIGIANHDGDGGAWPSIATLMRYANVSDRTVQRAIEHLVAMGELAVEVQGGGQKDARYRTNRYRVLVRCPQDCDGSRNHRSRGDVDVTPDNPGVTSTTPRGDAGDVSGVTPTSPEPFLEPSINRAAPDITTATGLAHAGATMRMKEYSKHNQVRHPDKLHAKLLAELLEENPARLQRLTARAAACTAAGQSLNVDAFAAAAIGEGHRAHLDTVNPDPRVCTVTCSRCEGVGLYEAVPGGGFQPCPGEATRHLHAVSAS